MSGTLIALLTACAETPGMPPYLPFDDALTDGNEHLPEQSECTPTDLAEIGKEPGLASSTPDVDETAISEDVPRSNPDLWLYRQQTVALLRRYLPLSIKVVRTPSPLGAGVFSDSSNALRGFYVRRLGYLCTRRRAQPGRIERAPEEIDREDRAPTVLEGRSRANPGLRVSHRGASFSGSAGSSQRGSIEKRYFGGSSQHKTRSAEKLSSG
jgi:hypothetical protein